MKIKVNEEMYEKFGDFKIGIVTVKDMKLKDEALDELSELSDKALQTVKENVANSNGVENIEFISKWQKQFELMNAKKGKMSSIESLYRLISEKDRMLSINPLVDLYNCVSVINGIPMGAYNLDNISGDITFRQARKGEEFTPLGLNQIEKTSSGEVIYADDEKVLCRFWNNKDCDQTKLIKDTNNIMFMFDFIEENSTLENAVNQLLDFIKSNGTYSEMKNNVLSKDNNEFEI